MGSEDELKRLFQDHFGFAAERLEPLDPHLGASPRRRMRLSAGETRAIGVAYDVTEENRAFISFSTHFRRMGLPVPEVYAQDLGRNVYLEEDLGSTTLFDLLGEGRNGDRIGDAAAAAYRSVAAFLPRFQVEAGREIDYSVCYPRDRFDARSIRWDLNYFKYYFLKLAGVPFNEQALENDFDHLTGFLLEAEDDFFMYRDFQSRNVMVRNGEPFFIDFQGGRRGALQYDIASLLFDAKADLPPSLRSELLDVYLEALSSQVDLDREAFLRHYGAFIYVRIMQAMGAYGYRGYFERKALFLASIPYAMKNLEWLMGNVDLPVEIPALMAAFEAMIQSKALGTLHS